MGNGPRAEHLVLARAAPSLELDDTSVHRTVACLCESAKAFLRDKAHRLVRRAGHGRVVFKSFSIDGAPSLTSERCTAQSGVFAPVPVPLVVPVLTLTFVPVPVPMPVLVVVLTFTLVPAPALMPVLVSELAFTLAPVPVARARARARARVHACGSTAGICQPNPSLGPTGDTDHLDLPSGLAGSAPALIMIFYYTCPT